MEVEAHGKQAHDDDRSRTNDTRPYVVEAQEFVAHPIEDTTNYARKGIDFLAENEGFDVDENITEHTTASTTVNRKIAASVKRALVLAFFMDNLPLKGI